MQLNINDARDQLEFLLEHVCETGARVVLEQDGQVVAALIGVADLKRLERLDSLERPKRQTSLVGSVIRFDDPFEPVWDQSNLET